jgi:hypothetical protein
MLTQDVVQDVGESVSGELGMVLCGIRSGGLQARKIEVRIRIGSPQGQLWESRFQTMQTLNSQRPTANSGFQTLEPPARIVHVPSGHSNPRLILKV